MLVSTKLGTILMMHDDETKEPRLGQVNQHIPKVLCMMKHTIKVICYVSETESSHKLANVFREMKSQGIRLVRVALVRIGERFDLFNAELDDQSFPQRLAFSPGEVETN